MCGSGREGVELLLELVGTGYPYRNLDIVEIMPCTARVWVEGVSIEVFCKFPGSSNI
jgi:hypothetical protein